MHTHTHPYTHTHTPICTHIRTHPCTHMHACTHTHAYTHTHTQHTHNTHTWKKGLYERCLSVSLERWLWDAWPSCPCSFPPIQNTWLRLSRFVPSFTESSLEDNSNCSSCQGVNDSHHFTYTYVYKGVLYVCKCSCLKVCIHVCTCAHMYVGSGAAVNHVWVSWTHSYLLSSSAPIVQDLISLEVASPPHWE